MKELSIEQKAQRYDEAIARANEMIKDMTNVGGVAKVDDIQYIFPELKESEDERIRKWIRKELESKYVVDNIVNNEMADKAFAWLEKQGKQNPADNKGMNIDEESMTPFQKKVFCIIDTAIEQEQGLKQVCDELLALASNDIEQKPAWSKEDEKELDRVIYMMEQLDLTKSWSDCYTFLNSLKDRVLLPPKQMWSKEDETKIKSIIALLKSPALCAMEGNKGIIEENIKYLKSFRDRVQPKQEWSEEDEKMIESLTSSLYRISTNTRTDSTSPNYTFYNEINWLKSLKGRCTWKPSLTQLNALSVVSKGNASDDIEAIVSLYNDLKKLREE